jgi:thymidylate synthase (FAD)
MDSVKLVWVTPNAEEMIVKMARVSAPKNQDNMETAPKLLQYLLKHKHISPFEMANMCVEINTTRAISAQILRHRSFSFQEFSQRYSNVNEIGVSTVPQLRRQDLKNRQNSIDDLEATEISGFYRRISQLFADADDIYSEMVSKGIAKECARSILPLASPTRMYMNGCLRSWLTYIALREKHGTQMEHMVIAKAVKQIFCGQFPIIAEAMGGLTTDWEI